MQTTIAPSPFGTALRRWRKGKGVSQLDLSAAAATTSRHVSFLETGRSRPSRGMVERLADALDLPLRERNGLLVAAGLAPSYAESALRSDDLAPFRAVVDRLLASQEPYPAYAIDGHWNIVRANRVIERLLPEGAERNVIRLTYAGAWRELIDNWDEIAWVGVRRIQAQAARFPYDEELAALVKLATEAARDAPRFPATESPRVLCPRLRIGDQVVQMISVTAHFAAPHDITLDEMRIELFYPGDAEAEAVFAAMGVDG